jgi:NTP pyrophosphatase (non-canonical NTP hydrolase)
MDFKHYQDFTRTTAIYPKESAIEYLALGLASEAGEVAGVVKKKIRDNTYSLEYKHNIKKEIGDCFWYLARLCDELNLTIDEVLASNVAKLSSRKERNQLSGDGDDR